MLLKKLFIGGDMLNRGHYW